MYQDPEAMLEAMASVPEAVDPAVLEWWVDRSRILVYENGRGGPMSDQAEPPRRKPGRPRSPDARRAVLTFRVTEEEKAEVEAGAAAANKTVQDYLHDRVWPTT